MRGTRKIRLGILTRCPVGILHRTRPIYHQMMIPWHIDLMNPTRMIQHRLCLLGNLRGTRCLGNTNLYPRKTVIMRRTQPIPLRIHAPKTPRIYLRTRSDVRRVKLLGNQVARPILVVFRTHLLVFIGIRFHNAIVDTGVSIGRIVGTLQLTPTFIHATQRDLRISRLRTFSKARTGNVFAILRFPLAPRLWLWFFGMLRRDLGINEQVFRIVERRIAGRFL